MGSNVRFVLACLGLAITATHLAGCGDDCGPGTVENNGECVVVAAECGPGTTLSDGNVCIAARTGCGPFTALDPVTRACEPSGALCGSGTSYDEASNSCVPTDEVVCGQGTVQQGRVCVLEFEPCAAGQVFLEGTCVDGGAVQLIHNAPDPAIAVVDVYVNGELIADDTTFRSASPFVAFTAGTEVTVVIADSNSADATPLAPAATTTFIVDAGDRIAVVVGGVVDTAQFAPGVQALALDVIEDVQSSAEEGLLPTQYSFALYQGAADVGVVFATVTGAFAGNVAYGALTSYLALERGVSALAIATSFDTSLRPYQTSATGSPIAAPTGVPGGTALMALTSGFNDPVANNNGPALAVVAALPTGGPLYVLDSGSFVQVVHNSLDAGAVDVYVGNTRLAAALDYRTASAFEASVATASQCRVFSAGADPASATPLLTSDVSFASAGVVVIDGLASASTGAADALAIHTIDNARTAATSSAVASVAFYNGYVAGAPFAVTSYGSSVFGATPYGSASTYVDLPTTAVPLDISQGGTPFRSIQTSSSGFYSGLVSGSAWLVFATGVATSPNFVGFAIVSAGGGAFTFADDAARAQLVHAAPVAEADTVDVYVNGFLAVNDLAYATATPFVAVPSGSGTRIDVAVGTSATSFGTPLPGSVTPVITLNNPNFAAGSSSYLVAVGDDASALSLSRAAAQESGGSPSFADTTFFNGVATSLATFENEGADINNEADDGTFGVDLAYGAFSPVVFNLPPASYAIEVADGIGGPFTPAPRGTLDLSAAGGGTRLVLAMGFLTPPSPDRAVRLFVAAPSGVMTELPGL